MPNSEYVGQARPWRDQISIHPAANLIPRPSVAEQAALQADLVANGMQIPLVVLVDVNETRPFRRVQLIDGITRLDSITAAGVELKFYPDMYTFRVTKPVGAITEIPNPIIVMLEPELDVFDLVLSYNAHRRHWDTETKAKVVAAVLKARPELSNRQIAQKTRTSHPFVGQKREELQKSGDVETVSTSTDTLGRKQPRTKKKKAEKKPKVAEPTTETVTSATDTDVVVNRSTAADYEHELNVLFDRAGEQERGLFLDGLLVDGVFFAALQHAPRLKAELTRRVDGLSKKSAPCSASPTPIAADLIEVWALHGQHLWRRADVKARRGFLDYLQNQIEDKNGAQEGAGRAYRSSRAAGHHADLHGPLIREVLSRADCRHGVHRSLSWRQLELGK